MTGPRRDGGRAPDGPTKTVDENGKVVPEVPREWGPLRARSGRRDDDRALVRTGQPDRIAFRVGAAGCEEGSFSGDLPGTDGE